jgi:hypothetical protein
MLNLYAAHSARLSSGVKPELKTASRPDVKETRGRPINPDSERAAENTRARENAQSRKLVSAIAELMAQNNTSLEAVLQSPAGCKQFDSLARGLQLSDDGSLIMDNVATLLGAVGSHSKQPVCAVLLRGVSVPTCTLKSRFVDSVSLRYVQNSRVPSVSDFQVLETADLFTQEYANGVTRQVVHSAEIKAQLHWCKTVEFHPHSGDTTETYYRVNSKVPPPLFCIHPLSFFLFFLCFCARSVLVADSTPLL